MPNHVTNQIKFTGDVEKIKEMLAAIQSDSAGVGSLDFNKIIPMPASLNIEAGSRTDKGLKAYRDFVSVLQTVSDEKDLLHIPEEKENAFLKVRKNISEEEWALGRTAFQNTLKYGAATWYEWAISHWGTKWNAYSFEPHESGGALLRFQTAWAAPHPVIKKLSELYPAISMEHKWANEDIGVNCGMQTYLGGKGLDCYIPDYGVRSIDFAADVMQVNPLDYDLMRNKTGTAYINVEEQKYEEIRLLGRTALYTMECLTDADIPENLYCYHLRTENGNMISLEPLVCVNCAGSVITDKPFDLGERGAISLEADAAPELLGEASTMGQFFPESVCQEEGMQLC